MQWEILRLKQVYKGRGRKELNQFSFGCVSLEIYVYIRYSGIDMR